MADSFATDPEDRGLSDEEVDGFAADLTAQPTGNRPAENARMATPDDRVEETWFPQEGATDFLGLEGGLHGAADEAVEIRLPEAMMPTGTLETAQAPAQQVTTAPETASEAEQRGASWLLDVDEEAIAEAAVGDDVADDDVDAVEQLEDSWSEAPAPAGGLKRALVGGMAAMVVGALGLTIYRTLTVGQQTSDDAQSSAPVVPAPTGSTGDVEISLPGDPTGATELGTGETPGTEPSQREAIGDAGTDPEPVGAVAVGTETRPVNLVGPVSPGGQNPTGQEPGADPGGLGEFLKDLGGSSLGLGELFGDPADPAAAGGTGSEGSASRVTRIPDHAMASLPPLPASVRIASATDLENIWEGSAIPVEAIARDLKLLTPWVGRVRTVLNNGEIFEGRLYAVGQGRVWLSTGIGRMALSEHQVARIDHLSSADGTASLGTAGSYDLVGLPRVRVRTPGGVFYGKVVAEDESSVTLVTDQGARIKLGSRDIEPANVTRTIVKSTEGVVLEER